MHRPIAPVSMSALAAACLLVPGWSAAARAEATAGPFDRFVAAWMSVVGVLGADADADDETESFDAAEGEPAFAIDDQDEAARKPRREHRHHDGDHAEHGRRRHPGGDGHGRPHHPGMGPPGGPEMPHPAMRALHEIVRRLGRIEQKLGIESEPPSGPDAERPRRPLDRLDIPEDVRRQMEERMRQGRRRMEEAKQRMEQAKRKLQAMEERIERLEAEVERLKTSP